MWDEFWEGVWSGIGEIIGVTIAKILCTKKGIEVLVVGVIVFILVLVIASASDPATISKIEGLCKASWNYHYQKGRMYQSYSFAESDTKYNYYWLSYSNYTNVALLHAKPKEVGIKTYMAIVIRSTRQKNYECLICKSQNNNSNWQYPRVESGLVYCPNSYNTVKLFTP